MVCVCVYSSLQRCDECGSCATLAPYTSAVNTVNRTSTVSTHGASQTHTQSCSLVAVEVNGDGVTVEVNVCTVKAATVNVEDAQTLVHLSIRVRTIISEVQSLV